MTDPGPPSRSRLEAVFLAERERALGRLAVEFGLISEAQLEEALRSGEPLAETLVARGWIAPDEPGRLWAELGNQDFRRPSGSLPMPEEAKGASADPARRLAEFILVVPLGRGGAGEVWKAWDTLLGRWVALKRPTLPTVSGKALERFRREAAAVARLNHPNIVPVHRVGRDRDRPYMVFQYIQGKTFEEERPDVTEAPGLIRTVALAVHHAHEQGIVHRDLKPGNLMRDAQGKVWILDFGLAFLEEGAEALTAAGAVIGTPSYMSPEQARGEPSAKSPLTDVYSLGATLYFLSTGQPPFEATAIADLIQRVAHEEPPPPRVRNPHVVPDLETVILKAMSRDPAARYPTAAALAEDLGRLEAEEPVRARPVGRPERVLRALRRRPAVAFLILSLLAGGLALGALWRGYRRERESALATIRETARVSLEAVLQLRRNGQNSGMRAFLPPLERAYRDARERAPDLGEPDYQMGRMRRALLDEDRALEHQERALERDPGFGPAHYERGVLLSRKYGLRYRRALETLKSLQPGRTRPFDREELDRTDPELPRLRTVILSDISQADEVAGKGILAFYQEQWTEARALLEVALKKDPSREELWSARAGTAAAEALQRRDPEEKLRLWREAEELYTRALERDRGYVPHYLGRGEIRLQRAKLSRQFGRDPLEDFARAEEDFSVGLSLEPDFGEAWLRRGETRGARAIHEAEAGREPFAHHDAAEEDLGRAIAMDPASAEAWMRRGLVRTNRAVFKEERKQDGRADYDAADLDFGEALRRDPGYASAWQWRGIGRANRAQAANRRNQDPLKDLDLALEDLAQALRLRPEAPGVFLWIGIARGWKAQALRKAGGDETPGDASAEEAYGRAIELDPDYADAYFWRGLLRARTSRAPGEDLEARIRDAEKDFSEVIRINPMHWDARVHRATLRSDRADRRGGEAARADYAGAAQDLREAIRINPGAQARLGDILRRVERRAGS